MYSEEDLKKAFQDGQDNMDYSEMYGWSSKLTKQEWFEQFKKERLEESNRLDDLEIEEMSHDWETYPTKKQTLE